MTTWGVYAIQGRTATNATVAHNDKTAVRWFVRWRVDGNLKKRTFPSKGYARTFHETLTRAKVMRWEADERGWPIDPDRPAASAPTTVVPGHSAEASDRGATDPDAAAARAQVPLAGMTFASYCTTLWWPIMEPTFGDKNMLGHRHNMRVAMDLLVYRDGDPRLVAGVNAGESILLSHLTSDDLRLAVVGRRGINDRTTAVNERALAAAVARGETDIDLRPVVASAATVRSFFVTLSMIVKAAMQSGHTTGDPLQGVAKIAPAPKAGRVSTRMVPSIDEVFDLADAIAALGPEIDGVPAGDRFRALVLAAGTLAARPGELVAHRPDLITFGTDGAPTVVMFEETEAAVYDTETALRGRRTQPLKQRDVGETRQVPAITEIADALRTHLERGYHGHDRTFTSPTGRGRLNWGNITDVYWKPACARVFGGTAKAALADMPPKTLRKAAITHWLDSGISIYLASDWAGHSTDVAELYYVGRAETTYAKEVELLTRRRRKR